MKKGSEIHGIQSTTSIRAGESWLNPLNKVLIREAVLKDEKSVILDGRGFDISYLANDRITVSLEDAFVPFGHFDRKTIEGWTVHG